MICNFIGILLKEVLLVPLFKRKINSTKTEGKEAETALVASEFSWEVSYLNTKTPYGF